jgi:hypothetical protein
MRDFTNERLRQICAPGELSPGFADSSGTNGYVELAGGRG